MFVAVLDADIVLVHENLQKCKLVLLQRFFESMDVDAFLPGKRYQLESKGVTKSWHDTWSVDASETCRIEEWRMGVRSDVLYCSIESYLKEFMTKTLVSDRGFEQSVQEWRQELEEGIIPAEFSPVFAHIHKVSTYTGFADKWVRLHGCTQLP